MISPTNFDNEVQAHEIKKTDLLDLTSQEAQMRDALKTYNQFIADKPSIDVLLANSADSDQHNDIEEDIINTIQKWYDKGTTVSNKLDREMSKLKDELLNTVSQSNRDSKLTNMNISDLQDIIDKLNNERDKIKNSVAELNTAKAIDTNMKYEYRSHHLQYFIFFIITIIVFTLLFRIQTTQTSGSMEFVILVIAVLFLVYHFSGWVISIANYLWSWLKVIFYL